MRGFIEGLDLPGVSRALERLNQRLTGELVRPGDLAYDRARQVQQALADRRPIAILRARSTTDVVQAVLFAREHDVPLAVRSGGHSLAGMSVADGALVVDLSALNGLSIDPGRRVAFVEPGVTSGQLAERAHEFGLGLSTGDVASVGLGGLTLGGGIGYFVRKYGLAIDHLLSVEVVTADGRLLVASANEHPDLFWGLRGGGGNFGIATRFEFRLETAGEVLGGALALPATPDVLRAYLECTTEAPDELTTIGAVLHLPPAPFIPPEHHGALGLGVFLVCAGDPSRAERIVEPLRKLGPVADAVGMIPYPQIFALTEEATRPAPMRTRSMFADDLPPAAIDAIIREVSEGTSPGHMVQLRVLGGAVARVPEDATAFPHRNRRYMVSVINHWMDPADSDVEIAWTERTWRALRPYGAGVYVNFLEDEGRDRVREAYGPRTYDRLAALKRTYDPTNLFRFNQNIEPA